MNDRLETGFYILRSLIKDVALSADGDGRGISITCVELWEDNLYVGTSAGEILHHVRIPPDPADATDQPSFILASRLQPPVNQSGEVGVQQIVLLPSVGKACILCNNALTFYTLPELSPAFPGLRPLTCAWMGGVDLDADENETQDGVVIMMCLRNKIRLVKITDEPLRIRDIEFGGCLATVRRGNFACVADAHSYALLDVVHQQKIPLFPISSFDDAIAHNAGVIADDARSIDSAPISRSRSPAEATRASLRVEHGHRKSSSLGVFKKDGIGQDIPSRPGSSQRYGFDTPASLPKFPSPRRISTPDISAEVSQANLLGKPLPPPPDESIDQSQAGSSSPSKFFVPLKPLIASPSSQMFLLVTGTLPNEPGVGMFVNLDGEAARAPMEFASYPESVVIDGNGTDMTSSQALQELSQEGYVLSVVRREGQGRSGYDVEVQRWDLDPAEGIVTKEWLGLAPHHVESSDKQPDPIGIRPIIKAAEISIPEIIEKLALKPMDLLAIDSPKSSQSSSTSSREKEEQRLMQRLCKTESKLTLWKGSEISWLLRNPTVLKLDSRLRLAQATSIDNNTPIEPQRDLVGSLIRDIRGLKPTTELDFFSLSYIRQKSATLLFMDLIIRTISGISVSDQDKSLTEEALIESELDPRVVLSFLPTIRQEILQGPEGIWVQGGLKDLVNAFCQQQDLSKMPTNPIGLFGHNILQLVGRFLLFWRRKKDHPSVTDGAHVFPTVDAALLHILLLLDNQSPTGIGAPGTIRAEIYSVINDGIDCFDRAVVLLEEFKRLYVLSRLYQKRKLPAKVLSTWRRIISGEEDTGGEFTDGEQELRKYLTKLRDRALVEEYGTWLAARNPKLGVQVLADESSKVVIPPSEALVLLRENAPNAVKDYLEYLVFGKKQPQHINELIAYYLDIVLDELEHSPDSRAIVSETYETYRALRPPKPTYRQFITDNALDVDWWRSRLRLLHLLGSNQGPASSYDVLKILDRLQPFVDQLVPEMIILNGRQGRHQDALRLLTHGLGDFDTAISYCLLGGSSIYRPATGYVPEDSLPTKEEQSLLFNYLLHEFLLIENLTYRAERTGELLERFGGWFDAAHVLSLLPDSWSIEIFSGFLINTLQRLVRQRSETAMVKALSGAQNLRVNDEFIEKAREIGPIIEGDRAIR